VAFSFSLHATSFCLVDGHLAAGSTPASVQDRACDFRRVVTAMRLEPPRKASIRLSSPPRPGLAPPQAPPTGMRDQDAFNILQHDVVIWGGDFNAKLFADDAMQEPLGRCRMLEALEARGRLGPLLAAHDELHIQRARGGIHAAFKEVDPCFAPTFKLIPAGLCARHSLGGRRRRVGDCISGDCERVRFESGGCGEGDAGEGKHRSSVPAEATAEAYNPSRDPAFTDRVLWRVSASAEVEPLAYERIGVVNFSDHRPVRLNLRVSTRKIHWDEVRKICLEVREKIPAAIRGASSRSTLTRPRRGVSIFEPDEPEAAAAPGPRLRANNCCGPPGGQCLSQ